MSTSITPPAPEAIAELGQNTALSHLTESARASQRELLANLQALAVKLWDDSVQTASRISSKTADQVVTFTACGVAVVETVFAVRDKNEPEPPWHTGRERQLNWGNGSLQTICGTLASLEQYVEIHHTVPDPQHFWSLRCQERRVAGCSFSVDWDPEDGIGICWCLDAVTNRDVGALPGAWGR